MFRTILLGNLIKEKNAHSQTGPFGTQLKASEYTEEGIPVINVRNIGMGDLRKENLEYLNDKKAEELKSHRLINEDIVFGRKGAVERHSFITKEEEGWIQGSDCIRLRFLTNEINAKFISYFFRTQRHQQWMINLGSFGATMGSLNQEIISKIKIPDFSIEKQNTIASILSNYDDLIENNNQRIQLLEDMAEEIYKEWFVRFRFPGYENAVFVDKNGNKVTRGNDDAFPEGWEFKLVKDIIKRYNAGKKYDNKTALEKGIVPILDQGQSGIIGFHNEEPGVRASIDNPIIVFANHTCYQNLIQFDFSAIQNILPFKSNEKYNRNIFWLHYATKDLISFNDYKGHWPEFSTKRVFVPKKSIAEKFGNLVKSMIYEIQLLKNKNQVLQETRDLLLPRLISGKLSVAHLLDDEKEYNSTEVALNSAAESETVYKTSI